MLHKCKAYDSSMVENEAVIKAIRKDLIFSLHGNHDNYVMQLLKFRNLVYRICSILKLY